MSQIWTAGFLESMRQETDPLADQAVESVLNKPKGQEWQINQIMDHMVCNAAPIPEGLPEELEAYFEQTSALPTWADPQKIKRGETFFEALGPECVTALFCKSLPECYAAHRGAQVLYSTGRLLEKGKNIEPLQRRIVETAQFLLNVMAPGGLGPKGAGLVTAQKIRLIHASIRNFLHQKGWDATSLGQPINQEDMAGTLLAFSLQTLEGLSIMGVNVSDEDQEAYLHAWNCVGYVMGIREELLCQDLDAARTLWSMIREVQFGASPEGQALNNSLIAFLESVLPGTVLKEIPIVLMNELMDDEMCSWLGLPKPHSWVDKLLVKAMEEIFKVEVSMESGHPGLTRLFGFFTKKLLQSLVISWNGEKDVAFEIPPSLRGNWPDFTA